MKIVAVQMNMVWEDKAANHAKLRSLLSKSSIEPGSLILAPEMYETGFSMNVAMTAQTADRAGEAVLRELAQKYQCAVMGGVAAPTIDGKSANQAVAFGPDGSELVRYQKIHPFSLSGEDKHFLAGDSFKIFEWQGVQVAPFVCYDLRFPETFRQAVLAGAELMTVIACWPAKRSEHWVRLLQARAIENLAAVVGVNRCGSEPGLAFDGRSSAFDHMGIQLFEASSEEQVLSTTIDIEALRTWREKFPALRDIVP